MVSVSEETKKSYKDPTGNKHIQIIFPEIPLTIGESRIYSESMRLTESISESNSIEFVGCISSQFKINIHNLKEDIKSKKLIAKIWTDDSEEEPITLFNGIVESAIKQSNKQIKEITAYDELYSKGNKDVSSWYETLQFPITLREVRNSLFEKVGILQEEIDLPNDEITIEKQYAPKTLQAISVIKAICQINGAFGIINRSGKFEYRILGEPVVDGVYPSEYLFPSAKLFPVQVGMNAEILKRADSSPAEYLASYKSVDYEEYTVKPVDKLTIRQTENDTGVTSGTGTNNYIIQGNVFTYGLSNDVLQTIADNIYPNVKGFSYIPFTSKNVGLPYLECGLDAVSYEMIDYERSTDEEIIYERNAFYILKRELTGIQALQDSYSAKGNEYQSEFITDLKTQIDILKQNLGVDVKEYVNDYTYDKETIDDMVSGGIKIYSVLSLPEEPEPDAIYLIQNWGE